LTVSPNASLNVATSDTSGPAVRPAGLGLLLARHNPITVGDFADTPDLPQYSAGPHRASRSSDRAISTR